jgi:hypothetical protein
MFTCSGVFITVDRGDARERSGLLLKYQYFLATQELIWRNELTAINLPWLHARRGVRPGRSPRTFGRADVPLENVLCERLILRWQGICRKCIMQMEQRIAA